MISEIQVKAWPRAVVYLVLVWLIDVHGDLGIWIEKYRWFVLLVRCGDGFEAEGILQF